MIRTTKWLLAIAISLVFIVAACGDSDATIGEAQRPTNPIISSIPAVWVAKSVRPTL